DFLTTDCGRLNPTGIDDPWLDYEEAYKRAHSYVVRRDIGWTPEKTYNAIDLLRVDQDYQYVRVQEAFRKGGFSRKKFSDRWRDIKSKEPFSTFEQKANALSPQELAASKRRSETEWGAAHEAVLTGVKGAARLERLLRSGQEAAAATLYRGVLYNTNLVTWSHWPPFTRELGFELAEFIDGNIKGLNRKPFERFVLFLSGQPSPERSKGMSLRPSSVRTAATFWLMMANPNLYLFLRRDDFAKAVSERYFDHRGPLITYDDYASVLEGAHKLSEGIRHLDERWGPRDLIDVQTMLWLGLESGWKPPTRAKVRAKGSLGVAYQEARVEPSADAQAITVLDLEKLDRGVKGHVDTQNGLALFLKKQGLKPLSPGPHDPEFDIGWRHGGTFFVGEVKSTTTENMEKQLRLGLGQVLRYRHQLQGRELDVRAVLIAEREPDQSWQALCNSLGVILVWSGGFERLLERAP
ncbi:MAG TPA: hypothetical protein VHO25_01685, partial [Polyangiaceae bacterium]|nr:hypothetical protein [Polyangiaceae bacterium]